MENIAIIPLGGVGIRMNSKIPKQFLQINNKPIFIYTVEKLQNNKNISKIVIACKKEYMYYVKEECEKNGIDKLYCVAESGTTQIESILNSIKKIRKNFKDEDRIIIHVGNRPNISNKLIDICIKKYNKSNEPLTTYVPCIESMIDYKEKSIINRDNILRIQTPQMYSFKDIDCYLSNIKKYYNKGNTICDLLILDSKKINYVKGEISNFKITYKEDYDIFKLLVNSKNKR